jgi:hypothetical protein
MFSLKILAHLPHIYIQHRKIINVTLERPLALHWVHYTCGAPLGQAIARCNAIQVVHEHACMLFIYDRSMLYSIITHINTPLGPYIYIYIPIKDATNFATKNLSSKSKVNKIAYRAL